MFRVKAQCFERIVKRIIIQNKDIAKQFHTVATQNKNKGKTLDIFEYTLTIGLNRTAFISKHTKS